MTAGRVASNGHVNTTHKARTAVPKGIDRDTRRTNQQASDVAVRELEQAAASLVVIALAGSDSGMVLDMLGLSS